MERQEGVLRVSGPLLYTAGMARKTHQLPLVVEKDEGGFYVVECPLFEGCYSQGKTLDEALANIREVIALALQEKKNAAILKSYRPREISLHTITV